MKLNSYIVILGLFSTVSNILGMQKPTVKHSREALLKVGNYLVAQKFQNVEIKKALEDFGRKNPQYKTIVLKDLNNISLKK